MLPKFATVEKNVGETPLEAAERLRVALALPQGVPLAYAGRLDPMASGKLLILIGEECKKQEHYHALDKEYLFEVLLGASSDTGDVLGLVSAHRAKFVSKNEVQTALALWQGDIELPYPRFSAKTVRGKPLHQWTLEGGLPDDAIPTRASRVFVLQLKKIEMIHKQTLLARVREKIETVPPVTDSRKALGRDFRRDDVRASWNKFEQSTKQSTFQVLTVRCVCSSGTYMRSLGDMIGRALDTRGLALSIHRTRIGSVGFIFRNYVFWKKQF